MELRRQFRVRAIRALTATAPILAALFGVSALLAAPPTSAVQSVPYLINFQGRLTDNNGNVLTDGSYNVKFRIFDAASGGTNEWEGDRVYGASDHRITVQNGLFNIQFGDTSQGDPALSPSLFNTQNHASLYLEVELPTPGTATCASNGCATWTEGAMTPRQPLASATYAFNSDTLDGIDSSGFVQLSAGTQTGSISVDNNITTTAALQGATETLTGANSLTLGTAGPSGNTGAVIFNDAANSNTVTLQAGNTSGNYTLTLPTAQASGTQILQNNGSGVLSWVSPSGCTDCVLNDSSITATTNTIAPTTDVSALTIRQTSAVSPTKNIFAITNSAGTVNYFKVDQTGQLSVGEPSAANGKIVFNNGTNANTASIYNDGNLHVDGNGNNIWLDGQSLYLNATSHNNVGINTSSPADKLTVNGNIQVRDSDTPTKAFRVRTSGTAVDAESGGGQLYLSTWSGADFTGTQYLQFILDNAGADIAAQRSMFFANGADRSLYLQTAASGNNGNNLTIQAGSGNGTDKNGGNLLLQGGNSTGVGTPGAVIVRPQTNTTSAFQVQNSSSVPVLNVGTLGDQTSAFTQLDGSSTTSGTGNSKTSMVLASVTNFDVGNYIRLQNGTACDGTATTCYAKITAVNSGTNTLTITPALTWGTGKTVDEWHIPEIGGVDTSQALTGRYGRGYFISGVATGNGTTYYNEDSIDTSLSSFDLLNDANLTTLNVGNAASTVNVPGALTVNNQSVVNSSGQINGAQLQSGSVANASLANSSLTVGTTGNLTGGGSVSLGGSLTLNTVNNPTFSTSVTTPTLNATSSILLQPATDSTTAMRILTATSSGSRSLFVADTTNTKLSADANLIVNSSVSVPSLTSVAFTSNSGGTLSGASGTTYFYRISAIVGSETAASGEQWVNTSAFTPLSAPSAPTAAAGASGGITGTYTYKYTYTTANGETSASPASGSVTVSNKKITVTIANGPTGTTGKKIYRTTTGPGTTWFLLTTIADNTTTTYTDSTADASLGSTTAPSTNTATTNLNSVTLTFPAFTGATGYRFYRGTSTRGEDHYQTAGSCSGTCTFTDTGSTGTAGTPIDPTAGRVGIGVTSPGYALDVSGNISASSSFISSGNVGQTQTCGAGNTFSGLTITGGIVTAVGSCAAVGGGGGGGSATLQSAYDNSAIPQINLSSGGGTLTVRDAATPLGTDLFDVQDNAGATTYLGVSATGITTSGSVNIATGQTYQINGTQISTSALSNGSSVTLQGNSFNGNSQLVQTTSGGALPALSGANLTGLNPTNLSTGSGAVSLASGTGTGLTLDSANGTLVFGTNTTTLQKAASALAIDLSTAGTSTLTIKNSNSTNVANLSVTGTINGATITSSAFNGLSVSSGTISVGTWNGTSIDASHGGTGQGSYAIGDILYASASGTLSKLSEPVSAGSCLVSGATGSSGPSWSNCSSASGASTSLNNLVSTSVNQSLVPNANNSLDLGSATAVWAHTFTGIVDAGTTTTTLGLGTTNATSVTLGNTTSGTTTSIQGGTGSGAVNIGSVGTSTIVSTIHIADTSNATGAQSVSIGSGANASSSSTLEGSTIAVGNGATAHTISIGTGAAAQTLTIGSTNSSSSTLIQAGSGDITLNSGNGNSIVIGSPTADANQVLLQLDSFSTYADTASCTTTTNQGALYYNTSTNAIRTCVNSGWEDVVTTAGLGLLAFGVVPDSGSNPGDLGSITAAAVNGPCKVSWASSTSVSVAPCVAYSGGRKVVVPNTVSITLGSQGNNNFYHICFGSAGTPGAPTLWPASGAGSTEAANLPTFSASAPVLCLADIKTAANAISAIYDVRTFTTTSKTFATLNATTGILGAIVSQTTTANVVQLASATTQLIRGVVVATAGSAATNNTVNMIIATRGPQYVKATGTAQTAGVSVLETTTAGYSGSGTASTTAFATLGLSELATTGTCSAAATCIDSQFTDIDIR